VMMGVLIGLIVGVAAVVGVVMYFSKAGTPFTNLQKMTRAASEATSSTPTQILSPGISISDASAGANAAANANGPVEAPPAPVQSASQPAPAVPPAKAAAAAPKGQDKNGQRFDFYKILPGQVDAVTSGGNTPSGNAPAGNHADTGAKKPYLQLGAFQNQDDADNLKAKLALIGVEATIQSADVPGKGIVHRVRVGPFATQADVDRIRNLLKQNGIDPGASR